MIQKRAEKSDLSSEMKRIDGVITRSNKYFNKDLEEVEGWIVERRKFFIKLGLVVLLVIFLLIISNLLMSVRGVGW